MYVRCGGVLPSRHLYQEHPPLPDQCQGQLTPHVLISPVRGVGVAAVHQEVGEHQHVPRPGTHWPSVLQRPLSLVHVVSPSANRGVSLNRIMMLSKGRRLIFFKIMLALYVCLEIRRS